MPPPQSDPSRAEPAAGPLPAAGADPVPAALDELARAADRIAQIATLVRDHIPAIREARERGMSYREILARAPQPVIGAVLTDAVQQFEAAGTRYRQAHGRALQREGMTRQDIGALRGLTRQRISELLQAADGSPDDTPRTRPGTPDGAP